MQFKVVTYSASRDERETLYLTHTGWDDWFKYSTEYHLEYVDQHGTRHHIGNTKIGQVGLQPAGRMAQPSDGYRVPALKQSFTRLSNKFFSLGQDPEFYEALGSISALFRSEVLSRLRDIAYDPSALAMAEKEDVTRVSLLRTVTLLTVQEQFNRLAHGGARLTPYHLKYRLGYAKTKPVPVVDFQVVPNSTPPTNIHVLIGRNGVGKSTFLNRLADSLVEKSLALDVSSPGATDDSGSAISNLVSVSFSAFDQFEPLSVPRDRLKRLTYHYVGLKKRRVKAADSDSVKGPQALAGELTAASRICFEGPRRSRWLRALRLLEADPIFEAAGVADVVENAEDIEEVLTELGDVFKLLSSGHKIVLLTITKLIETVEEKSLVLLDEPEAHLHPPLLSAFDRALSDLLVDRNGVAIVATHSPVVLQEVPRTCVWKIDRNGPITKVDRPKLETFGENVGVLTNEVFGLEVTGTGFHRMLWELANRHETYEDALAALNGQLGSEGRAILRAMVLSRSGQSRVVG